MTGIWQAAALEADVAARDVMVEDRDKVGWHCVSGTVCVDTKGGQTIRASIEEIDRLSFQSEGRAVRIAQLQKELEESKQAHGGVLDAVMGPWGMPDPGVYVARCVRGGGCLLTSPPPATTMSAKCCKVT